PTPTTDTHTLSLHDALPISHHIPVFGRLAQLDDLLAALVIRHVDGAGQACQHVVGQRVERRVGAQKIDDFKLLDLHDSNTTEVGDRKSTRLNSSHVKISYAV